MLVVDTNIVSLIFKGDTRAALYQSHLLGEDKLISFMPLAELRLWASRKNWGERRKQELENYLSEYAVFYADNDLCTAWVQVRESSRLNGKPIDTADAWVAAVALLLNVPLVTHNRTHFEGVNNLTIISETK